MAEEKLGYYIHVLFSMGSLILSLHSPLLKDYPFFDQGEKIPSSIIRGDARY